jgi:hypothetical protein
MKRIASTAAALLLLAFAAAPASAQDGSRLTAVSETVRLPVSGGDTVNASCPRGEDVVSGGFEAFPRDPFASTVVFESRRSGKSRWLVSGGNLSLSSAGSLTAYAYCSADAPKLVEETGRTTIPARSSTPPRNGNPPYGTAVAGCDRGSSVVSGGFALPELGAINGLLLQASRRIGPRAWAVGASNDYPLDRTFTAYAYCGPDRVQGVSDFSRASGRGDATRADSPKCGRDETVVSGGFEAEPLTVGLSQLTVFDSHRAGDGWKTTAAQTYSGAGLIETHAYCAGERLTD